MLLKRDRHNEIIHFCRLNLLKFGEDLYFSEHMNWCFGEILFKLLKSLFGETFFTKYMKIYRSQKQKMSQMMPPVLLGHGYHVISYM